MRNRSISDGLKSFLVLSLIAALPLMSASAVTLDTDFEGGSAKLLTLDAKAQRVRISPAGDPAHGWPCWWHFRLGAVDKTKKLLVEVAPSELILPKEKGGSGKPLPAELAQPKQAYFSHDGVKWLATEPGRKEGNAIVYEIQPQGSTIQVAWGPPYPTGKAAEFLQKASEEHPAAEVTELCTSRGGRAVPMLRICEGDRVEHRRFGIWVHARQHAWEAGSSWVAQGFVEWLLGASAEAAYVRQHAEVFVVPVMDVDHVAAGQGGKDGIPHDHNRDWSERPHWNEVAAAQKQLKRLADEKRLDIFVDLHNPAPRDHKLFFFTGPEEGRSEESIKQERDFLKRAHKWLSPEIELLPETKPVGEKYHPLWRSISVNWVLRNGNPGTVSVCLEAPWNTEHSSAEGYRAMGAGLAQAVAEHVAALPLKSP